MSIDTSDTPSFDAATWHAIAGAAAGRLGRLSDEQRRRARCLTIWCGRSGNCRMGTVYNLAEGHLLVLTGKHRTRVADLAEFFTADGGWEKSGAAMLEASGHGTSVWSSTNCHCSNDDVPVGFDLILAAIAAGRRNINLRDVTDGDSP